MPISVAVPTEQIPEERRVALVPDILQRLTKLGAEVLIEKAAGERAYFLDADYKNGQIVDSSEELYKQADVILKVQAPTQAEIALMKQGAVIIGFMSPYSDLSRVAKLRDQKITSFSMELVPRISRAQYMDALSSQAAVAGYKAVIRAADLANIFFPMLTTAAGTIRPAKVVVVGVGVAGLQAIATAKRLGANVEAYDIRPETKEQVESLGATFINVDIKANADGGYARELTAEEKQKQQNKLAEHIAAANVVITTAAIPGRASPKIITTAMVENMKPGSVIVDIAAEGGGNCELTKPGETIEHQAVTIEGPLNIPSQIPVNSSEMYAKNVFNLLSLMIKDGELQIDWKDEILAKSALTHAGEITHAGIQSLVEGVSA
jgi:NAD(P) transhydrogenase subunit alpha